MFGHPAGLKTLFFTELWERLSYYGMRAILVLFLVDSVQDGGFGMTVEKAGAIYGLYTAFVYLMALPGGWIADRLLGLRQSVFLGGCIIAAGHFSMALPFQVTFYLGLVLIVIGTGLLKPNISAMVGDLYPEGGARRDAGFSIYYMGINIGALIGPLICGFLGEKINWHLGFSAAGVGMVFGVIQYKFGLAALGQAGAFVPLDTATKKEAMGQMWKGIGVAAGLGCLLAGLHVTNIVQVTLQGLASSAGLVIVLIAAVYFGFIFAGSWTLVEKKRIGVILILFLSSALFWSGFEQAGSSMNLFADRMTDLNVLGFEVPASWLQSVNPLFIILLAPVFAWLWIRLGSREPSIPVKMALGLILLGVGFLVLAWGATFASETQKVSPMWLVTVYFLHTSGELCLSPVGLSSVTKLAPRPLVGQMMGVWFTGAALGNLIAGLLGGLFESLPLPQLFGSVFLTSITGGFVLLICAKWIGNLIQKDGET